ncbi:PD-(D/E)XK nuclease family protein [Caproicibacter fermentans]|uniref:PD-(D/E)XK nuclease family protein n=1 Tax=Caproicibacter fermentans TaxID=2576756 RepID=A0A7G8TBX7_9FIRM|nr:PD-(D/E)XK nuclease family protein [Caproicibacter fermentans]QNK41118.1 PD-(D/E)XK nuclease family protein [Caproicibacter fermentans]
MLRFVLGRAGSGKTQAVRNKLKNLAQTGEERLMLLVPEQASFENERAMLRLLGPVLARRVTVTSFSRLTDEVLRGCGGFAGRRLDDGGRSIFMSLALEQVKDQLDVYRKNSESTELIGLLLSACAEFKMCAVTPRDLSAAAERMRDGTLKRKISELSLIFSAYDALVSQSFVDPLDDLTRLKNALSEHSYFSDYTVMVDSFQSFTVQEYDVLSLILRQAKEVCVALCTDRLDDPECGAGLFSLIRRTAKILVRIARQNGVPVAAPNVLEGGARFQSEDLKALEGGIYRPAHQEPFLGESKAVAVYEAKNSYDESAFVAATVRRLVIDEGYRYRDFAVIARNPESYRGILDEALEKWEIPYFMDRPEEIDAEPLMRLVLSAFQITQNGFRSDDILLYLKTGLCGLSPDQISLLENYTFLWNISGRKWLEEWTDSPEGFAERKPGDPAMLSEINRLRSMVVGPLKHFFERTEDADGTSIAAAVFRLLEELGAAENLKQFAGQLSDGGDPALADRELRIWDLLMEILDQTALVIGKNEISAARYAELLRLVILSSRIASIPQGLDEVTVGAADRSRPEEPKIVFLVGCAQGEFPLSPGEGGLISDRERHELINLGLELNDTAEGAAIQERFLAYSSMCAASRKLYLSYPVSDAEGKANSPSTVITEALAVLPKAERWNELLLEQTYFASARGPLLELAAQRWSTNDRLSATLKELMNRYGKDRRLASVANAAEKRPFLFGDADKARDLFGSDLRVSATQIEKYHLCRFQYFCRYGIDARERKTAELNALEYGSFMHYLLQRLFQEIGSEAIFNLDDDGLRAAILNFMDDYVKTRFGGLSNKTPRFTYLITRIADSAGIIARRIAQELSQSGFEPVDFELPIGETVPALEIPLPDGGKVSIDGKIDRVDVMTRGGTSYLRVVDYKTGQKEFRLSDVIYGMNLQMLIYLAALCENGKGRYGEILPAGVLYMPANRPSPSAERGTASDKLKKESDRQLRMDGLILNDADIVAAMEPDGKGAFIPVTLKDGVPSGSGHLVTDRELKQILRYIRGLIETMAAELKRGNVSAVPLSGGYDACAWCPYGAVCGHERDDPEREMQKWDRDAVLAELSKRGKTT